MPFKIKYKKDEFETAVEEAKRDLYTLEGEEYKLTGFEGLKTEEDINKLKVVAEKERTNYKTFKSTAEKWESLGKFEDIQKLVDEAPALRAAAEGSKTQEQIDKIADARAEVKLKPVQRELEAANATIATLKGQVSDFEKKGRESLVLSDLDKAALEAGVVPKHFEDVRLYADKFEVVGDKVVTKETTPWPRISAIDWLKEQMLPNRPGWLPPSEGTGTRGSNTGAGVTGDNPFDPKTLNVTKQMVMIAEDREKARKYAKAAGQTPTF
jgi:hypothetical protein